MLIMDGKGGMEINAPKGLTLNASRIEIKAGDGMLMNVGNNFTASVGGNWLTNVGNTMNMMAGNYRTTVVNGLVMTSSSALFSTEAGMQLQGETLNAIGTRKLLMHSDECVQANSRGQMDMKSDGNLNMVQKADEVKAEAKEEMALATVEFRPDTESYKGEFGFDWLRVDDGKGVSETAYKDIIEGGYCDGTRNLTKAEAYERLKREYGQVPITFREGEKSKYFVPYLNLYSENYASQLSCGEGLTLPCYEVSLRMLVDIKEDVDRLEFEYDKTIFEINKTTLKDKAKTAGKVKSEDEKVKIKCKESFDDANKGVIRVYAYPKGCADKTEAEQMLLRSLAGKIKVGVNDAKVQKEVKFVLVGVRTFVNGDMREGKFDPQHLELLSNTLHQMYVNPTFIQYVTDKQGYELYDGEEKRRIILDLTQNRYWDILATHMDGNDIAKNPIPRTKEDEEKMTLKRYLEENLAKFLRAVFLQQHPRYSDCFTIFSFANNGFKDLRGFCELAADIKTGKFSHFKQNVVVFGNRLPTTLCHEALHGLGLLHTHLEEEAIEEKEKKFIFERETTDNVMSYADDRKTTWRWQWEIVRNNIE